jgi:hypothetical protein
MTKQEFKETKTELVFIVSVNPATGEVLYDTYDACTSSTWMGEFKRDFPDMIHLMVKNQAAIDGHKKRLFLR